MLNRKIRPDLEEVRSRLSRWAVEVPARATRFHDLRADLDQQVSALLGRWLLRAGDAELASLRGQVDRLEELASPLTRLIRQAEEMEKEVLDLRSGAERTADRDVADWLTDRCVDWQSTLRRLGSNVGRRIELEQDQPVLERARERVRRHAEALRRLDEARQLLARLGDKVETASLRADLPLLRQRLFEEGAAAAWLAEMERAVAPLRAVVDLPPPKPPKDLEEVRRRLSEARRWARTLRTGEEATFGLHERTQVAEAEWGQWTDEQIRDLLQEVSQLLSDLRRTAADRRAAALALLGKRSRQLAAACGPNADLERELAELTGAEAGEPETYEVWTERQTEMDRHLLDAAGGRLVDLQEWIVRLRQDLAQRLSILLREPLSARAASEAGRLRLDLEGLPDPYVQEAEDIFHSLETCDRIQLSLDELAERARAERETLRATHRDLIARNQALREEVARCGIEVSDLASRIETLSLTESERSLDDLRRLAEDLELEMGALEKELVARCKAWIAERLAALRPQAEMLLRLGSPAAAMPADLDDGATPSQAARAVSGLREIEMELARQLDEVELALEARGMSLLVQLQEVLQRPLRPEVRRDAANRVGWLQTRPWRELPKPDERIRRLLSGLEQCDALLTKLSQLERNAQSKAKHLRLQLQRFNELDLDRFCPGELVQRASALIAAIPAEPPSWNNLADQLDAADELIRLLQVHACRVRAARLERAIPSLKRQALTTKDPVYARRLQTLLDELAAHDESQSVRAELAVQVLMLAPDGTWEGEG